MDSGEVEPTTSGLQTAKGGRGLGGRAKSDSISIRELANPAPGMFLAKATGTPASRANFREKCLVIQASDLSLPCGGSGS